MHGTEATRFSTERQDIGVRRLGRDAVATILHNYEEQQFKEGVSERQFATRVGVSRTTLQYWRSRKANLSCSPVAVAFFREPRRRRVPPPIQCGSPSGDGLDGCLWDPSCERSHRVDRSWSVHSGFLRLAAGIFSRDAVGAGGVWWRRVKTHEILKASFTPSMIISVPMIARISPISFPMTVMILPPSFLINTSL